MWFKLYRPAPSLSAAPPLRESADHWICPASREPSLVEDNHFVLLGVDGALTDVGWDGPQREKLWRYNQHYFDDLNAKRAMERTDWHHKLMFQWVSDNPPASGTGWEPYPTSLRIVNWIKWSLAGNALSTDCVHSLAVQARWLRRRLEWHLLGNHLFANAKALIFAGLFFEGAEAANWLRCGCRILRRELPEQILEDGGHFELSPMYHALALEDVLDLINIIRASGASSDAESLLAELENRVMPMLRWLKKMCHPDDELSFFNDAAFGIAPTPTELGDYAERLGFESAKEIAPESESYEADVAINVTSLQSSGYVRIDAPNACALLDVAPIGPDYLPGHAHADTLSFEFSAFGQRVFVNSGTSVYGISDERLRQRGTAAHNTVTVDDTNSSEVWSGFRVARRARPMDLAIDQSSDCVRVNCGHTGYRKTVKPPVIHVREWRMKATELTIADELLPAVSASLHPAQARYHLHPGVTVSQQSLPSTLTLRLSTGQELHVLASAPIAVEQATWHPFFGASEPTHCLVLPVDDGTVTLVVQWGNP